MFTVPSHFPSKRSSLIALVGCKPCWALIEYALGIDLPDVVADHPVVRALNEHTNDLVTWSNVRFLHFVIRYPIFIVVFAQDIFSYNVEQARGDTHNMIVIYMQEPWNMSLQKAIDRVGEMCHESIEAFTTNQDNLPTEWFDEDGNQVPVNNDEVQQYVKGLQNWIVGFVLSSASFSKLIVLKFSGP